VRSWRCIEQIVRRHRDRGARVVLVCSAVAGVTNLLQRIIDARRHGPDTARQLAELVDEIETIHDRLGAAMGLDATGLIAEPLRHLRGVCSEAGPLSPACRAQLLSLGEVMSTHLGAAWLRARGLSVQWLDARDVLTAVPEEVTRDEYFLSARCDYAPNPRVRRHLDCLGAPVIITQGFVARGPRNETVLLGRGGSDTSAAYLAALIAAERLEIWSDVPGMFTADPRRLSEARLLRRLSYGETESLAALGARVLHPRCIEPLRETGIPLRLGWTTRPEIAGTLVSASRSPRGPKAIAARKNLALISMRRPSSWQPVGFLAEVSACFQRRGLSMDLVASAPSEIRATVDVGAFPSVGSELDDLAAELAQFCAPQVLAPVACVSVVGRRVGAALAGHQALRAVADAAVHMMAHAANGGHVSAVLDAGAADNLILTMHEQLFGDDDEVWMGPSWADLNRPTPNALLPTQPTAVTSRVSA
jgi:bifunctional diaminopimelate decarboxylase / aspartate kinase